MVARQKRRFAMVILIAVLLLALILGGLGFVVKALWIAALIVLVLWLLGFVFRAGDTVGGPRRRWYRW
jgi:type IV secretory pathway TrbD component